MGHWGDLVDELKLWSKQRTTAEVQPIFDRHGGLPSSLRYGQGRMADPRLAHRNEFAEIADAGGTFRRSTRRFRLSAAPVAAKPFVAAPGEHTETVLARISQRVCSSSEQSR